MILAASFLLYANTLDNDFVLDDTFYIEGNYLLRDLGNLPQFFNVPEDGVVEDLAPGFLRGRNIRWVTYAVDFALGNGAPWMFHLSNILWHALTGIVLFALFKRWFQRSSSALLGTLLFLAHPIQTSAVAYISGRKDILATFFVCCAFLAVCRYRETANHRWLPVVLGLFFVGCFSKEVAVVFPVLLFFSDWCLNGESRAYTAFKACCRHYWREYIVVFAAAGFFVWRVVGTRLMEKVAAIWGGEPLLVAAQSGISLAAETNLSFANLMVFYLAKLVWPVGLVADYKGAFNFSVYPAQYGPVVSSVFLGVLIGSLLLLRRHVPLAALGLGWIVIALLPVSHIVDFHYPVAEHYLYLPCAGFALLVGSLVEREAFGRGWTIVLLGVAVCYAVSTPVRNVAWQSMETITLDILEKAPGHQRARNTLVHVFAEQGRYDAALAQARVVLQENPSSAVTHYNLGFLYEDAGNFKQAESSYRRAIYLKPTFWAAYLNLGNMLLTSGDVEAGLRVMERLNDLYGYHPLSFLVLGVHQARQGRWVDALAQFERGLRFNPNEGRLKLGAAVALWTLERDPARVRRLYVEVVESDVIGSVEIDQEPWKDFFTQPEFRRNINQ